MKIDFGQRIKDFDGKDIITDPDSNVPATLGIISVNALMGTFEDEKGLSGQEKVTRFDLALAIHAAQEPLDLSVDDLAKIKNLVGKAYAPLIVGQAWKMLDPKDDKPES